MTETDTSRVEWAVSLLMEDAAEQNFQPCEMTGLMPEDEYEIAELIRALLARAEKAEAERDTTWNDAIEAAAECVGHITQSEDRDAILALRKGDTT